MNQQFKIDRQSSFPLQIKSSTIPSTEVHMTILGFCIHGNKVGVAYCCDDLWPTADQVNDTTTDDKAPLVDNNETNQKRLQRNRSVDAGK